jgi:hypothetical protein
MSLMLCVTSQGGRTEQNEKQSMLHATPCCTSARNVCMPRQLLLLPLPPGPLLCSLALTSGPSFNGAISLVMCSAAADFATRKAPAHTQHANRQAAQQRVSIQQYKATLPSIMHQAELCSCDQHGLQQLCKCSVWQHHMIKPAVAHTRFYGITSTGAVQHPQRCLAATHLSALAASRLLPCSQPA